MYKKEDSLSIDLHFERVLTPCHNVVTKMSLVDILKSLSKLSHELKDVSNKSLPPYTFIFILNPFVTLLPYRFSPPPLPFSLSQQFCKRKTILTNFISIHCWTTFVTPFLFISIWFLIASYLTELQLSMFSKLEKLVLNINR